MKKTFTLLLIFIIGVAYAQVNQDVNKGAAGEIPNLAKISVGSGMGGSTMTFFNPPRQVDGSEYLFDDWNNYAIIVTEDNKKFGLKNINLNIKQNTFVSKVDGDSLFTFNFNNIDKVQINGKNYKNYYWDDDNRVYEIIYEGDNWSIIKGFKIVEVTGSANPMLNRTRDRLVRKEFYYLKDEIGIHTFILKKKKVIKLIKGDGKDPTKTENFAKTNRLSYKKEEDLRKILEYSENN